MSGSLCVHTCNALQIDIYRMVWALLIADELLSNVMYGDSK